MYTWHMIYVHIYTHTCTYTYISHVCVCVCINLYTCTYIYSSAQVVFNIFDELSIVARILLVLVNVILLSLLDTEDQLLFTKNTSACGNDLTISLIVTWSLVTSFKLFVNFLLPSIALSLQIFLSKVNDWKCRHIGIHIFPYVQIYGSIYLSPCWQPAGPCECPSYHEMYVYTDGIRDATCWNEFSLVICAVMAMSTLWIWPSSIRREVQRCCKSWSTRVTMGWSGACSWRTTLPLPASYSPPYLLTQMIQLYPKSLEPKNGA